MIFVTIGVTEPFSRLIKKMDEIALEINEEVIIQRGDTEYVPENCESFQYCPEEEYQSYLQEADLVVSHAGTGTVLNCAANNTKIVLVPRRSKFGEHKTDHQVAEARTWNNKLEIPIVEDVDELESVIHQLENIPTPSREDSGGLTEALHTEIQKRIN